MTSFTHIDDKGHVRMVDVADKPTTDRLALAQARISMAADTFERIADNRIKKGNVLETARIAGVMAAKRTHELIPMCHPIHIRHVQVDFFPDPETHTIRIQALVRATDKTGVEMEALTAAAVAGLTVYDMCKSHDREMAVTDVCLLEKTGGKSGAYKKSP
ncbi:MAG: cyclic pyranopterin monophosphate synthase MoaC [Desulfobacterales bacterium]